MCLLCKRLFASSGDCCWFFVLVVLAAEERDRHAAAAAVPLALALELVAVGRVAQVRVRGVAAELGVAAEAVQLARVSEGASAA